MYMLVIYIFMDLINSWKMKNLNRSIILDLRTIWGPPSRVIGILHFVTKSEIIYWPVSDNL